MADVYTYLAPTGVIKTDAGTILAEVQQEYKDTFGQDLIVTPNTPQGMLISVETAARIAVADNNAALANQINPQLAGGIFLDALIALTNPAGRSPGTPSTVYATISGVPGTSIPAGSQASETGSGDSNIFQTVATVVIPVGGTITGVEFQSVALGPIPCATGTLTAIISNILGWETVTNPAPTDTTPFTYGTTEQSDTAARLFRQLTLAAQGMGLAEAIVSGLMNTTGVTSLTFQENVAATTQTINSVPMVAHSLYTCVAGTATDLAIATTLTNKKSGGCSYNNGKGIPVSQAVVNPYSGQSITVLFDRPSTVNIVMTITVHAFTTVQDIQTAVQNAVLQYAAGGIPNEPGFVVGASVSPFQIAGAINILVPGLFVQEVQIARLSFTQIATVTNGSANVTGMTYNSDISTGWTVTGTGVPGSTTVSSLTGSTGLVLSNPVTASPSPKTELLTFVTGEALQTTEIPIQVWQQAFTQASYITVTPV